MVFAIYAHSPGEAQPDVIPSSPEEGNINPPPQLSKARHLGRYLATARPTAQEVEVNNLDQMRDTSQSPINIHRFGHELG
jgi:hypothetical protein